MKRLALTTIAGLLLAGVAWAAPESVLTGWRTDGSGRYPQAQPPTTWGPDRNIVWATALPGPGNSTPVLVGDKLLMSAEPFTLLCVSAADGQILWQKPNPLTGLVDEKQAAQIEADRQQARQTAKKLGQAMGELRKLKTDLQDDPDNADLKAKVATADKQAKDLGAQMQAYQEKWYSLPAIHPTNGFSSPTPVSDGVRVFTWYGSALVVAYDLYGTRLWHRVLGKSRIGWGPCSSPVLVGDKLIIHGRELYALDKSSGEILWHTPLSESYGTPAVATVGGTQVVLTAAGDAVRVSDGAILAQKLGTCTYCSPLVQDGVVYYIQNGGKAVRLQEITDDKLKTETLWTTKPPNDRYYASPVLQQGLIYCATRAGEFSVLDAATGEVIYSQKLNLGKGNLFSSLSAAGQYIYVVNDNGNAVVVKSGRQYAEVARNSLEPSRAGLIFVGEKLYLRGLKKLYCISGK